MSSKHPYKSRSALMSPRGRKRPLHSSKQLPQILVSEQLVIEAERPLPGIISTDLLRTSSATRASRKVLPCLLLLDASYPSRQTALSEIMWIVGPLLWRCLHRIRSAIRRRRFLILQINPQRISNSADGPNTTISPWNATLTNP